MLTSCVVLLFVQAVFPYCPDGSKWTTSNEINSNYWECEKRGNKKLKTAAANLNSENGILLKYFFYELDNFQADAIRSLFLYFNVFISRIRIKSCYDCALHKSKLINLIWFSLAIFRWKFMTDCKESSETSQWPTHWIVKTYTFVHKLHISHT